MAKTPKEHYELLTLEEIYQRRDIEKTSGNEQNSLAYKVAASAIEDTKSGARSSPYDLPAEFNKNLFSMANDGERYKVIDPVADVDWTDFELAQKSEKIKAERVEAGTEVMTVMADGHHETTNVAGSEGGYRVTNPAGEQYLVQNDKFEALYDKTDNENIYQPKSDLRKVLPLSGNVAFTAPWGEEMKIRKDGVLVNGGKGDIYGIQPAEYKEALFYIPY